MATPLCVTVDVRGPESNVEASMEQKKGYDKQFPSTTPVYIPNSSEDYHYSHPMFNEQRGYTYYNSQIYGDVGVDLGYDIGQDVEYNISTKGKQ